MSNAENQSLATLCVSLLHEIAGYAITEERVEEALPLIRDLLGHIRHLDEVSVETLEPATTFKP